MCNPSCKPAAMNLRRHTGSKAEKRVTVVTVDRMCKPATEVAIVCACDACVGLTIIRFHRFT